MASFHVFVEGPSDESPGAVERLAAAIAKHYGLGAADLLARLQKGRFRVKTNTDEQTAATYKRDLERLGARCTIEEATAANSQRATPSPFPAVRPATPPAGTPTVRPSTPPPATSAVPPRPSASTPAPPPAASALPPRPSASTPAPPPSALPPRAATPPPADANQQYQSGLAAAFSGEMPAADLGALGAGDVGLSLASLDGVDDTKGAGGSFGPPPGADMPASIGPAADKQPTDGKAGKADKPKDEPLDMFAPPDMQGDEFKVDIAADEDGFSEGKRASTPPTETANDGAAGGEAAPMPAARKSQPSLQAPAGPVVVATSTSSKLGPLGDERVRFVAGVVLSVLLGFVPAHFIAKMQEDSADAAIDRKVIAAQQTADTPDQYATLDRMRADQLDRKNSEHRNAAIIGFALWAIVGGGLAFLWFRKIPWDALEG